MLGWYVVLFFIFIHVQSLLLKWFSTTFFSMSTLFLSPQSTGVHDTCVSFQIPRVSFAQMETNICHCIETGKIDNIHSPISLNLISVPDLWKWELKLNRKWNWLKTVHTKEHYEKVNIFKSPNYWMKIILLFLYT